MNKPLKTESCMICNSSLDCLKTAEMCSCIVCGKTSKAFIKCPQGHHICEDCRGRDIVSVIEDFAVSTVEKSPALIAEVLMSHPRLPMLGCEHAKIAAGALLAGLRNSPYCKISDKEIADIFIRTGKQAVGGFCGLTGVCGIAPAIGACFSVFLDARCGSDTEQKMVMETVIKVSQAIADLTGPSCCKAYVRAALDTAVTILAERFGIVLPSAGFPIRCSYSSKHPGGCRGEKCPYYSKPSKDIFADSIHLPAATCHT
jgi:hypothetical protein